ncbi:ferric enterobactin transporter FepD [Azorhizobium oxalatiphilum]|uniref:Ferric enterobactin transporter FepD n=1 Tax=Azorhizobium oxalatiphilum TaxID=980631 RepID=A0A917C704_9HYPH|nr:iron chelate uptake ABC transporter family permease subunit [Azorhizobium oxalatiphilum]GGF75154.1 ferric enterobactin transporter FepD [Azorhizobium oxalatiphilum]
MSGTRYLSAGAHVHLPFALRFLAILALLGLLLAGAMLCGLWLGSTDLPLSRILRWLLPFGPADADTAALMQLRLPRVIVAVLGGAMVAASGYLLQVISGNALADPGLLGISQGTVATILLGGVVFGVPAAWLAPAGLGGGLAVGALVLLLAARLQAVNGLILIGLAVSISLGAVVEIIMVSGGIDQFVRYMSWSHGTLTAASMADAARLAGWALVLAMPLAAAPRAMAPLLLGSAQAASLGAAPHLSRPLLTLLAAALVAPVVAIAGPFAFLGLIAAHTARRLVGDRPGEVLPVTMLTGALLLLAADMAGRTLFLPMVVPAGLLVSVAGVIGFLAVARAVPR